MDSRQATILQSVIDLYIKTAEPVGSQRLCGFKDMDWSPATIRAELLDLEDKGYLSHPHTSAGRIPTEKGYRYYVDAFVVNATTDLSAREQSLLADVWSVQATVEDKLKATAKLIAQLTQSTAIIAHDNEDIYYTGIKNLFAQPEFAEWQFVTSVSEVLDELEDHMDALFSEAMDKIDVLIGRENPLGARCSTIAARLPADQDSLLLIFGPMRMNYSHNIRLLRAVQHMIDTL